MRITAILGGMATVNVIAAASSTMRTAVVRAVVLLFHPQSVLTIIPSNSAMTTVVSRWVGALPVTRLATNVDICVILLVCRVNGVG